MKSVQIGSFSWSVFPGIRTEYGDLWSKYPYSFRIQENTDQEKLRIWTLFTQYILVTPAGKDGEFNSLFISNSAFFFCITIFFVM